MRHYHSVFIPLEDVYRDGGVDVFAHLARSRNGEKNLVVVPTATRKALNTGKDEAYKAVLAHLKDVNDVQPREEGEPFVLLSQADVDIALMQGDKNIPLQRLEEIVKKHFSSSNEERPVFITDDALCHIDLKGTGLIVQDPRFLKVSADIVNEGVILGNDALYAAMYAAQSNGVPLDRAGELMGRDLFVNQFIKFMSGEGKERKSEYAHVVGNLKWNGPHTRITAARDCMVRFLAQQEYTKKLCIGNRHMDALFGIAPRDMEQYLALQHGLLNQDVSLFFLCGSQGSGKTLLSYVAAIDQVLWHDADEKEVRHWQDCRLYRQVVLLKPNEVLGGTRREVGFLPGSLYDKIKPHIAPYVDAHKLCRLGDLFPFEELLRHPRHENDFGKPRGDDMKNLRIGTAHFPADIEAFEVTYSGFMRGRSFENTLLLVDEAQNFTPYELKTILERLGEGSKAIVMGDPAQFDNPLCTRERNGLTHAIKHFLGRPYAALVTLGRNYRSQASEDALGWRVYSS